MLKPSSQKIKKKARGAAKYRPWRAEGLPFTMPCDTSIHYMTELFRKIPKIDDILRHEAWKEEMAHLPAGLAKEALHQVVDDLRNGIRTGVVNEIPPVAGLVRAARSGALAVMAPKLKRVINGTGVIIHTNLGRSLLSARARDAVLSAAEGYSNLEYDIERGERGDRYGHATGLLEKITGAEGALVVNNNAAAVYLVLNTLSDGRETILSRGELVEIGGSFRIPEVMEKSGAILREVGTTNRTYAGDFENAITDRTGLIARIHPSNFKVRGFTHTPPSSKIVGIGKKYSIPTFLDAGSGMLIALPGIDFRDEPLIPAEVAEGFDVVSFSGDKLLGGPQAGIIVGTERHISAMKKNPLTRALRPDKFTLAALEATLTAYLDPQWAQSEIPTLRMILASPESLGNRARRLAAAILATGPAVAAEVVETRSEVGGGTLPDVTLVSWGIAIKPHRLPVHLFEERLRRQTLPLVGRIEKERLILDMRTLCDDDDELIVSAVSEALRDE